MDDVTRTTLPPYTEEEMLIIKGHLLKNISTEKNVFNRV